MGGSDFMSILTSASSSSVRRGYDYYKSHKVKDINQLNDCEFEGYVDGSRKSPYYVKINIEHPRKSYCECPHANGNITCKHMTALYFELFPDEVDDYESWLNSDYDDEDEDEYDYYDNYYDYTDFYDYSSHTSFEEPLFFDVVLENFVNNLDQNHLRELLKNELSKDKKRTYEQYLENNYKEYLKSNNNEYIFLENLNKKVLSLTGYYNYDYNNFDKEILSIRDKQKLEKIYLNSKLKYQIDKILLNEKLSVYSDYSWIAKFYKNKLTKKEISDFTDVLNNYLDSLKHYSIKNSVPKSNILITIYLLNDYNDSELAKYLLKNAKYLQYVDYVIENCNDVIGLYNEFLKLISKNYFKNKIYIPDVLYYFVSKTNHENKEININHYLYSYLCLGHKEYLDILSYDLDKDTIIKMIECKTKDIHLLRKLYNYFDEDVKLWNLLKNTNYEYMLLDNISLLKDKYNNELYNHFIEKFYTILKEGKSREIYHKASKYIWAIGQLNDGEKLVNEIIINLKKSEYQKCSALFDEIKMTLEK